ncbi:MAG: EAL domain-containing protein [Campylobacter sp.]|nr:EAL domain-containing protein [Campylobacter sp.]
MYSELKERQSRFWLSLKIAFPLILLLILGGVFLNKDDIKFSDEDVILFVILVVCYVYYVVYLIYFAFKNSNLDDLTKVFNRSYIDKFIKSKMRKKDVNIILVNLSNYQDIIDRYGYKNAENILKEFVKKLYIFIQKNDHKNVSIGRYASDSFLFLSRLGLAEILHTLKQFETTLRNNGILNIEVKVKYTGINSSFDSNYENVINTLFLQLKGEKDDINHIKIDYFDELVCYSIDNREFQVNFQTIRSLKSGENLYYLLVKLDSHELGIIQKNKILYIAQHHNYEIKYDIETLKFLSENLNFKTLKNKIVFEISAVSLRSQIFKNEINLLINQEKIIPSKIIFEFFENLPYEDTTRLNEIILEYKRLGFSFAISHFGNDNAGYNYIKTLDIDYVFYDMEVNKTINLSSKNEQIFKSVNDMLQNLGIKTIVKFIDKKETFERFKNYGVDYIQGFYIDKPTDIKKIK